MNLATRFARLLAAVLFFLPLAAFAQTLTPADSSMTVTPSGARISNRAIQQAEAAAAAAVAAAPRVPVKVPEFSGNRPVIALASAIGGQLSYVLARESTGSNLEPYTRHNLLMPDNTLDVIVLRGLERVVAQSSPDSERLFMRLNPILLDDIPPPEREAMATQRLIAELRDWPQRQHWDRIIVVVPHYRGFERGGLGSRLHGIGVYVQNLDNTSEYDVIEPNGSQGAIRRSRYVALYYYATLVVIDAKSLRVIETQPWLIDQKIYDSNSDALNVANAVTISRLAERIESFAEGASRAALTRTLGGRVEPGEPRRAPR